MRVELGVQANCSEATIRIQLNDQDPKKVAALYEKLQLECDEYFETKTKEWDEETPKKELELYETQVFHEDIFGMELLTIKGDGPYNQHDAIEKIILKYLKKPKMEISE